MALLRSFASFVLLFVALPVAAQVPQRVVTLNLCLDQMAIRLAAPGQLVGVSYLSQDPRLSALAGQAAALSPVRDSFESILTLRPDLVILGQGSHASLKRLLRGAGVQVLELPWATSIGEAETVIEQMAAALGREEVGRSLIAGIQRERRRLTWTGAPLGTAVYLEANRGTSGKDSLMDELLRLSGYRNLAAELGIGSFGRLSLETVLAGQPDLVVFDGAANDNPARATEFVGHHVLLALAGKTKLASVPTRFSICAGPDNFEVMRRLAEARR
ncbi:MAG: iron complex transport system substrate-binding protein [Rhodospirillaceae bacterium]|nr:MAG: iron complex transport system substrate-binding protein [Rhodospirillaceae bacterium]